MNLLDRLAQEREQRIEKARDRAERQAVEVYSDALAVVELMRAFRNGYGRISGHLRDFDPALTKHERDEAIAAFQLWIDNETIAPQISTYEERLKAIHADSENLDQLLVATREFIETAVHPSLDAKRATE